MSEDDPKPSSTASKKPRLDLGGEQNKVRSKRLFGGLLMGTLQQRASEQKTQQELKRDSINSKLEEKLKLESEQLKFVQERQKAEKREKLERLQKEDEDRLQVQFEQQRVALSNFIKTKAGPPILYLPAKHTPETEKLLEECKAEALAHKPAPMARSSVKQGQEGEAADSTLRSTVSRKGRSEDRASDDDDDDDDDDGSSGRKTQPRLAPEVEVEMKDANGAGEEKELKPEEPKEGVQNGEV